MYRIYCDNELMSDPRFDELLLINPIVTLEENKASAFTFTIIPDHPFYDKIHKRTSVIDVYQDDELIFEGQCVSDDADFYKQKNIVCEGELGYFNESIQRPARYQGLNVRQLLETYVNIHNAQVPESKQFEVGIVTVVDDYIYCYSNMDTTLECLKGDLQDDLGGYFRIRHESGHRYIDYLADSMYTNNQPIKLGINLLDYKSNIDTTDIATVIIPLGALEEGETEVEGLQKRLTIESVNDGKDYLIGEAVNTYGPISKVVTYDSVTTPATLKRKGEKFLTDVQFENVVIEAQALDLHMAFPEIDRFHLSDNIRVVSSVHGLDRYFRLTRQIIYLNEPEKNTVTLGKSTFAKISAQSAEVNDNIKKAIDSITPVSTILKAARENATALINGAGKNGAVVLRTNDEDVVYEILVMDTPSIDTATKMWRWNINGLGYRAKDLDTGEWSTYNTAITMDGQIVADFITTGTLTASIIKGGVLTLGGMDNVNGQLVVKDEAGNDVILMNKDGVVIHGGSIYTESPGSTHPRGAVDSNGIRFSTDDGFSEFSMSGDDPKMYMENASSGNNVEMVAGGGSAQIRAIRNSNGGASFRWDYGGYGNLEVSGNVLARNISSDITLKTEIADLNSEDAKRFVYNLKPKRYVYKDELPKRVYHGFIAQEAQPYVYDNWGLVTPNPNTNKLTFDYQEVIADLVSVIQSQHKEIEKLTERVGKLEVDNG